MKYWLLGLLCFVAVPQVAWAQEDHSIVFPVKGEVSFQNDFLFARGGGRVHHATDIMAKKMLPVLAAADGVILFAPTEEPSYGYMIMLGGDDGYQYNYVHVNNDTPGTDDGLGGVGNAYAPGIRKGVRVTRGQHIAYVGDSGNAESTGPHVHFEMLRGDEIVNPYSFLIAAQKSLLSTLSSVAMTETSSVYTLNPTEERSRATSINVDQQIAVATSDVACTSDALIRTAESSAVYYCGSDGGRYLFQNESTFFSWYNDFSTVTMIDADVMGSIPLRGTVTYKPGTTLVQLASTSKVYAVSANGTLQWIPTADIATALYGTQWTKLVQLLPDSFFPAYHLGDTVSLIQE